jgi:hypothetical protein
MYTINSISKKIRETLKSYGWYKTSCWKKKKLSLGQLKGMTPEENQDISKFSGKKTSRKRHGF